MAPDEKGKGEDGKEGKGEGIVFGTEAVGRNLVALRETPSIIVADP